MKIFFKNYVISDENYQNTKVSYQKLYFQLLNQIGLKIKSKKNFFILDKNFEHIFNNFFNNAIKKEYCLVHIDERWDKYEQIDTDNLLKIITNISRKYFVIVTTGAINFPALKKFEQKFKTFDYVNNALANINTHKHNNVYLLRFMPLNLLAYFVRNSKKCISSHSGPILNFSAAFNVDVIDIIKKEKYNELGRWIPLVSKYKRYSFEEIENHLEDF